MPGYIAKKLCPHLIFVKPDFTKYSQASKKVMDILARYGNNELCCSSTLPDGSSLSTDPNFAPASLDEAYMNMTAFVKKSSMTAEVAISQMRAEVKQETGLTVSAGCGANTMLAKIAADVNKPDGQYIVSIGSLPSFKAFRVLLRYLQMLRQPRTSCATSLSARYPA